VRPKPWWQTTRRHSRMQIVIICVIVGRSPTCPTACDRSRNMDRTTRRSPLSRSWLLLGLLAPFRLSALAQGVTPPQQAVELESITVEGNRPYDMAPSEQSGGYTVPAATVGTKTPA